MIKHLAQDHTAGACFDWQSDLPLFVASAACVKMGRTTLQNSEILCGLIRLMNEHGLLSNLELDTSHLGTEPEMSGFSEGKVSFSFLKVEF